MINKEKEVKNDYAIREVTQQKEKIESNANKESKDEVQSKVDKETIKV